MFLWPKGDGVCVPKIKAAGVQHQLPKNATTPSAWPRMVRDRCTQLFDRACGGGQGRGRGGRAEGAVDGGLECSDQQCCQCNAVVRLCLCVSSMPQVLNPLLRREVCLRASCTPHISSLPAGSMGHHVTSSTWCLWVIGRAGETVAMERAEDRETKRWSMVI